MYIKSALALAILASLTACGSSDDSTITDNSTGTTYTVIDGYLSDANVCVIAPDDADETCIEIGRTDNNGEIVISEAYEGYTVVATILAGQTKDSDQVGYVTQSYEMRSAEGVPVVTPYTTIAALDDNTTLEDIANTLDLDIEDIAGDYTENKEAHLIAQVLAAQFDADNSDDSVNALLTMASEASSYISNIDDLDGIELAIDDSGSISSQESISRLNDFLEDENTDTPRYIVSLSPFYYQKEGMFSVSYVDGTYTYFDGFESFSASYRIDADADSITYISTEYGDETDTYIYVANDFALSVPNEGDINVTSMVNLETTTGTFITDELVGTTLHYVESGTENSDKLFYAKLEFTSETEITVYVETADSANDLDDGIEDGFYTYSDTYNVNDGQLTLEGTEMTFEKVLSNDDLTLVRSLESSDEQLFALLFSDYDFANAIKNKWEATLGTVDL